MLRLAHLAVRRKQPENGYVQLAGIMSTTATGDVPEVSAQFSSTGLGGTAFGFAVEGGFFVSHTVSVGFEASVPGRFDGDQIEGSFPKFHVESRHRAILLSGVVGVHFPIAEGASIRVETGPTVAAEDTVRRTAPEIVGPSGIPTGTFGPFGSETTVTRQTIGVLVGADRLVRRWFGLVRFRLHRRRSASDETSFALDLCDSFQTANPDTKTMRRATDEFRLPWRGLLRVMAGGVIFGLSPAEQDAVGVVLAEREIAAGHRRGLRQIHRQLLTRPARLNLGSGRFRKDGFLNVDAQPEADVTLDLRRGLPFDSDCCELIFSEHCFEHFDYPEPIGHLLRECLRVLRPGGMLRFSVPDTEWPLTDYRDGPQAPYFKACIESAWHPAKYTTRIEHINYHFRQDSEHRFAYDFETAQKILGAVGFVDVRRRSFDPSLDSEHRRLGSLFVSAQKAASPRSPIAA